MSNTADASDHHHQELVCTPFGECKPCPPDELDQPFCQPFGNRRLMHCQNASSSSSSNSDENVHHHRIPPIPPSSDSYDSHHVDVGIGETPAWSACGRISSTERADFYEFIACNLLFALAAIAVVCVRSRRRSLVQARQLAARIGLVRNRLGNGNGNAGEG